MKSAVSCRGHFTCSGYHFAWQKNLYVYRVLFSSKDCSYTGLFWDFIKYFDKIVGSFLYILWKRVIIMMSFLVILRLRSFFKIFSFQNPYKLENRTMWIRSALHHHCVSMLQVMHEFYVKSCTKICSYSKNTPHHRKMDHLAAWESGDAMDVMALKVDKEIKGRLLNGGGESQSFRVFNLKLYEKIFSKAENFLRFKGWGCGITQLTAYLRQAYEMLRMNSLRTKPLKIIIKHAMCRGVMGFSRRFVIQMCCLKKDIPAHLNNRSIHMSHKKCIQETLYTMQNLKSGQPVCIEAANLFGYTTLRNDFLKGG
jgi:hypothetical protein